MASREIISFPCNMAGLAVKILSAFSRLHPSWMKYLGPEFQLPYMRQLEQFLAQEEKSGKVIYPAPENIFNAFNSTPLNRVEVVILGQDPYHGPGQAHGLCFSVQEGVAIPPSLRNIFKEIKNDLDFPIPQEGSLQHWADQGVLLLNATLTVEEGKAGSHQGKGWEQFTDTAIKVVNEHCDHVVFMLWGNYAHKKTALIDESKHCVLTAAHPSPLSAHRGFLGCKHFSKANEYLESHGKKAIDWRL